MNGWMDPNQILSDMMPWHRCSVTSERPFFLHFKSAHNLNEILPGMKPLLENTSPFFFTCGSENSQRNPEKFVLHP